MRRRATDEGVCSESAATWSSTVSITRDEGLVVVRGFLGWIENNLGRLGFADAEKWWWLLILILWLQKVIAFILTEEAQSCGSLLRELRPLCPRDHSRGSWERVTRDLSWHISWAPILKFSFLFFHSFEKMFCFLCFFLIIFISTSFPTHAYARVKGPRSRVHFYFIFIFDMIIVNFLCCTLFTIISILYRTNIIKLVNLSLIIY